MGVFDTVLNNPVYEALEGVVDDAGGLVEDGLDLGFDALRGSPLEGALHQFTGELLGGGGPSPFHYLAPSAVLDAALSGDSEFFASGGTMLGRGVLSAGSAVVDVAGEIGEMAEGGFEEAKELFGDLEEDAKKGWDDLSDEVKEVVGDIEDEIRDRLKKFFGFDKLQKAIPVIETVYYLFDYMWEQMERVVVGFIRAIPTTLRMLPEAKLTKQLRAMLVGFQPQIDRYTNEFKKVVSPIAGGENDPMWLMSMVLEFMKDNWQTFASGSILNRLGMSSPPLDDLVQNCITPLLDFATHAMAGGIDKFTFDVAELLDTVTDIGLRVADWSDRYGIGREFENEARAKIRTLRGVVDGTYQIPVLSHLYELVMKLAGNSDPPPLSLQRYLAVGVGYAAFRFGDELGVSLTAEAMHDIRNTPLPGFPTPDGVQRAVEDFFAGTVDDQTLTALAPAPPRLASNDPNLSDIQPSSPPQAIPPDVDNALSGLIGLVELVGMALAMGETIAVTIVGGMVLGTVGLAKSAILLTKLIVEWTTFKTAQKILKVGAFVFELFGAATAALGSVIASREGKEITKIGVALFSLMDLIGMYLKNIMGFIEKGVDFNADFKAGKKNSEGALAAGIADSVAEMVAGTLENSGNIILIIDDPVVSGQAGVSSAGLGTLATKAARVVEVMEPAGQVMNIARVMGTLAYQAA